MLLINELVMIYEYMCYLLHWLRDQLDLFKKADQSEKDKDKATFCSSDTESISNQYYQNNYNESYEQNDTDDLFPQINYEQFNPNSNQFIPFQPFNLSLR